MSTRRTSAAALASVGILATGWGIGTAHGKTLTSTTATGTGASTTTAAGTTSKTTTGAAAGTTSGTTSGTTTGTTSGTTSGSTAGSATYVGSRQSDRWGSLQVTVTVTSGKITNITYTTTAGDGKSLSIEARATPTLKSEVLAAQSAQVSSVSGATYTSTKYLTSLQSALDQIG
ncbi:MAG TPA: FMN-binding protein [Dermatophilaceae bacterium]|jgi:uncharacterized protein with FMN-binding domain|nr:FMN-binding protein [Dermatophilaceae bacterium]